jgi:hypothetical protein
MFEMWHTDSPYRFGKSFLAFLSYLPGQRAREEKYEKNRPEAGSKTKGARAHPIGSTCVFEEHDPEGFQVLRGPHDPQV